MKKVTREIPASKSGKQGQGALQLITHALKDVSTEKWADAMARKTKVINVRVSELEKSDIQATAELVGVTVTEYLLMLHNAARTSLTARGVL